MNVTEAEPLPLVDFGLITAATLSRSFVDIPEDKQKYDMWITMLSDHLSPETRVKHNQWVQLKSSFDHHHYLEYRWATDKKPASTGAKWTTRLIKTLRQIACKAADGGDEDLEMAAYAMELDYTMLMYATKPDVIDKFVSDHAACWTFLYEKVCTAKSRHQIDGKDSQTKAEIRSEPEAETSHLDVSKKFDGSKCDKQGRIRKYKRDELHLINDPANLELVTAALDLQEARKKIRKDHKKYLREYRKKLNDVGLADKELELHEKARKERKKVKEDEAKAEKLDEKGVGGFSMDVSDIDEGSKDSSEPDGRQHIKQESVEL